jgi:hypothetical protein
VTSGNGLNPAADAGMPIFADARLKQLTTGINADAGLTYIRFLETSFLSPSCESPLKIQRHLIQ